MVSLVTVGFVLAAASQMSCIVMGGRSSLNVCICSIERPSASRRLGIATASLQTSEPTIKAALYIYIWRFDAHVCRRAKMTDSASVLLRHYTTAQDDRNFDLLSTLRPVQYQMHILQVWLYRRQRPYCTQKYYIWFGYRESPSYACETAHYY